MRDLAAAGVTRSRQDVSEGMREVFGYRNHDASKNVSYRVKSLTEELYSHIVKEMQKIL